MSTYTTPAALGTPWPDGALRPTRMRSALVALLACIPLPLLSVGAMLLPIPELAQRAAATFAPIAPFLDDPGEHVVRQRAEASPLRIRPAPGERAPVVTVGASTAVALERRADPSAARSVSARKAELAKAHEPTTTSVAPARTHAPDGGSDPEPGTESPQPPVSPKAPGGDAAAPASTAPKAAAPEPARSGSGGTSQGGSGKSGSSGSTTGSDGPSAGTGGETSEPQPPGGGSSSSPGNGAGGGGQGSGAGSAGGGPPDRAGSPGAPPSPPGGSGSKGGGKP